MRLLSKILNFNSLLNLTLDENLFEIVSGRLQLKLQPNPGQIFNQDFSTDVGFTYDSSKSEFVGGLAQQKDLRPANAILAATYTSSKDLNWASSGSLTGTDIGAPVLNSGKVDCIGYGNNAVQYSNSNIGVMGDTGTVRLKYTPAYSGTPSQNVSIVEFAPSSGNSDRMVLFHSASGGTLRLTAYTSAGTIKHSAAAFDAAWSPVSGTEYELELDWNTIAGLVRLFIDGVLKGSMPVSSYARSTTATLLYVGAGTVYTSSNASFNDIVVFNAALHLNNYTPGYTLPEYIYSETKIDGPNFVYSGVGTVLSVDSGSTIEVGTPRYIVGGKYWNGSAWVASNGAYAQANSFSTALTNFPSFDTGGGGILSWSLVFGDSNIQSSVDSFSVEVTGEIYPLSATFTHNTTTLLDGLNTLTTDEINPSGSSIKYAINIDGVNFYWNGLVWAESDLSSGQTNTLAAINSNLSSLAVIDGVTVMLSGVCTSDGTDTPSISLATMTYGFFAGNPTEFVTTFVYGWLYDVGNEPLFGVSIKALLTTSTNENNTLSQSGQSKSVYTDVEGYWELELIPGIYTIILDGKQYLSCTVPEQDSIGVSILLAL